MVVMRKILNWYARLSPRHGKTLPPYDHVVQIGDPTLRRVSEQVPVDKIKTNEVQAVIKKLKLVLSKYDSFGMSAPQIGVNLAIFVMNHTKKQMSSAPDIIINSQGWSVIPFTVFINPKMKIIDFQKVIHSEGCESVQGYIADVPRYRKIELTGYNAEGDVITEVFENWAARIAQHEIDHLHGKMYIDIMDRKTFTCRCWEEVNMCKGKVTIPFAP